MEIKKLFEEEIERQCGIFSWKKDIAVKNVELLNNKTSENIVEIYFKSHYVITLLKQDIESVGIILTTYFWGIKDQAQYNLWEEMKKD